MSGFWGLGFADVWWGLGMQLVDHLDLEFGEFSNCIGTSVIVVAFLPHHPKPCFLFLFLPLSSALSSNPRFPHLYLSSFLCEN